MAILFGVMQPVAMVSVSALLLAVLVFKYTQRPYLHISAGIVVFILAVLFLLHKVPGFLNPKIIDNLILSTHALPFSKYLNLDKITLGCIFLLFIVPSSQAKKPQQYRVLVTLFMASSGLCFLLAYFFNLVIFELKFPHITLTWLLTNLFFTCYVEEVFFRGFIQAQCQRFNSKLGWQIWCIALSGGLFGLVHFPAGYMYCLIATIMGCCYAYIYWRSKNIYLPIGFHFAFNCMHYFLFTYPFLA